MATTKLSPNIYETRGRLTQLENAVAELQRELRSIELKEGRPGRDGVGIVGPVGPRGERGSDGRSIVGPAGANGSDGRDGRDGIDGKDSTIPGPMGPKGDPGSVTYIGPAELEAAVQSVRAELIAQRARFVAAVGYALERNKSRECHPTIARTVDAVLRKIKLDVKL